VLHCRRLASTLRLKVEHDALVAEADAEVLKAAVAPSGLRQDVVELGAVDGGDMTGRGPNRGLAPSGAMIVVEHPPESNRVAQLHGTCGNAPLLEVVLFAVDVAQMPGLLARAPLADEHLDLGGEAQEAGVEVAGDPVPAGVGDAGRRLGGVVALVLAEQHDLGAVILAAQRPRLVLRVEGSPEVGVAVWPALGFESPAAVGVSLEAHQRALSVVPGAVFESVGVAGAGGDLRADAEVADGGLLAAARGQLVDVAVQLVGGRPGARVGDRQLAHAAARGVGPQPVHVPHDPVAGDRALGVDRVEPVDRQLAQSLQVGAFAAEPLE